ncbi:MAG TPA: hypothetical protein VNH44_03205 [Micropepsaceae bacterium]|nr:hypothetical protein [Micropepsaceae bacterium]
MKTDLRCRFNELYTCREMSIVRRDGAHAVVAAMFYQHRLYQIEGTVLPAMTIPNRARPFVSSTRCASPISCISEAPGQKWALAHLAM